MKTKLSFISILLILAAISCDDHETPIEQYGHLSFHITGLTPRSGDSAEHPTPMLLLSLETSDGQKIFDQESFNLVTTGQESETEKAILLPVGDYEITKVVLISGDKAFYAIPREGSARASSAANVAPIRFEILPGSQKLLTQHVMVVHDEDRAQDFGYDSFGVGEEPGNTSWMDIRVKFEPTVGKIFYANIDAEFMITGYDEFNNEKWRARLPYTGPGDNDLKIRTGFDHYVFEVEKWKVKSRQEFKGAYLWERRVQADVVPTTFVFSGSTAVKKLAYVVNYTRSNGSLTTDGKTSYQYNNDGTLASTIQYQYSSANNSFVISGNSRFTYQSGRVSKIETFNANRTTPSETTIYAYDEQNRPIQIQHRPQPSGISTEVTLQYSFGGRVVNTIYKSSNGQQFEYSLVNELGSIKSDKTTRGDALCSEGTYSYDKGINPFSHLGYVDFLLRNFSINNRITEQVQYVGCSFPSFIPEFTDYNYDGDGYPASATKHYKESDVESITRYFYQ
ncbi:hypothetical protein WBG78_04565 [Chryseolinea sp. T2]|uniref:hypothetical protein n=1 Tax=Chryseolinea sp. T2 TaxID=3129255 RepID=UPI00307867FB